MRARGNRGTTATLAAPKQIEIVAPVITMPDTPKKKVDQEDDESDDEHTPWYKVKGRLIPYDGYKNKKWSDATLEHDGRGRAKRVGNRIDPQIETINGTCET